MNFTFKTIAFLFLFTSQWATGQTTVPTINFIPDANFAPSADWDAHLPPIPDTGSARKIYSDIAVARDGRFFLIERKSKSILRFDAQGEYLGRFGGEGNKAHQFKNVPPSQIKIVDQRYLVVNTGQWGRLSIFNLEGEYLKEIKLDYPIRRFRVLPQNRLLILGWIMLKDGGYRDHVAILNLETQKTEKITHFEQKATTTIKNDKRVIGLHMSPGAGSTYILTTGEGDILISHSDTREIQRYQGATLMDTFTLPLSRPAISDADVKQYRTSAEEALKQLKLPDSTYVRIAATDFLSKPHPYYYHLETLPGHRLLAFILHEGSERRCHVLLLENTGRSLGEHVLSIDGYDPPYLSRGASHITFNGEWMYALVTKTRGGEKHFSIIRAREQTPSR